MKVYAINKVIFTLKEKNHLAEGEQKDCAGNFVATPNLTSKVHVPKEAVYFRFQNIYAFVIIL